MIQNDIKCNINDTWVRLGNSFGKNLCDHKKKIMEINFILDVGVSPTHKVVILTKSQRNWVKIVDFLNNSIFLGHMSILGPHTVCILVTKYVLIICIRLQTDFLYYVRILSLFLLTLFDCVQSKNGSFIFQ